MHNEYLAVRETNVAHLVQTGRHLGQKGNIPDGRSAESRDDGEAGRPEQRSVSKCFPAAYRQRR